MVFLLEYKTLRRVLVSTLRDPMDKNSCCANAVCAAIEYLIRGNFKDLETSPVRRLISCAHLGRMPKPVFPPSGSDLRFGQNFEIRGPMLGQNSDKTGRRSLELKAKIRTEIAEATSLRTISLPSEKPPLSQLLLFNLPPVSRDETLLDSKYTYSTVEPTRDIEDSLTFLAVPSRRVLQKKEDEQEETD
ncbi:hypothetical protein B0H16DRAFT_1697164 [Mycena metata]|uniref:Uncharacterized protein n=1 Tax=Mycena metata TaxID=1033252 RepID=A0AAD7HXN1_9AGAR|nr:hypothetical protein B0H16DRAFT_1697164 [Mycena metata]